MRVKNIFKSFFAIVVVIIFTFACKDDILKDNQYTYYITAKVSKKRFLLPMIDHDSNSNSLYENDFLRLHMGTESKSFPVEIIIYGLRLDTLKLPAKIPVGNFMIALREKSIVKPNNEKCKKANLDCYYVANDRSEDVNVIITKFTNNVIEGTFSGHFHAFGFNYFIVNDLEDKINISEGYFKANYNR